MHPAIPPAAIALAAASMMAGYVLLRREKRELHWALLALLASLMVWTTGIILRFSVATVEGLEAAIRVTFLGVFATPPLWLLVAAHYARFKPVLERRELWVALGIPSALAYLALLTNEAHGLVLREVGFEVMQAGGLVWAGPLFWAFLSWAYVCVGGGALIYLRTARSVVADEERSRGLVLALASLIPLLTSALYLFGVLPLTFDLTASGLTISLVLLFIAVFRYQLLESLPLAHRDVIEHLHDGVLMANGAGVILDLNPAAERILGCGAEGVRRRRLSDVIGAFAQGDDGVRLADALASLSPGSSPLVAELRTGDGRRIELNAAWVRGGRGEPAGRFAVLRDRTEERVYERVMRRAQKLQTVGTLASGIAHEVNNPLAFIRANLSQIYRMGERVEASLEGDGADAGLAGELADLRQIAAETLDGIGRIERIVMGMRRLVSAREEVWGPIEVNQVVKDALRLSNLGRDPSVAVRVRLEDSLPRVHGVAERLVQALLNLLVNARQALEGGRGEVSVETASDGDGVEIRVRDDGPGIPEEIQERIFDPFFTTKDPDRGTGLGLSIAFDILRDHGGVLEVRSKPGGGACFAARLPIRPT